MGGTSRIFTQPTHDTDTTGKGIGCGRITRSCSVMLLLLLLLMEGRGGMKTVINQVDAASPVLHIAVYFLLGRRNARKLVAAPLILLHHAHLTRLETASSARTAFVGNGAWWHSSCTLLDEGSLKDGRWKRL